MLKIKLVSTFLAAFFAVVMLAPNTVNAQKQQPKKTEREVVKVPHSKYPICSVAIGQTKKDLQKKANLKCETQKTCVPCKLKATGDLIYANLVVQPVSPKCKSEIKLVDVEKLPTKKPAPQDYPDLPDFANFEILQVLCKTGGTSLELYIPGADFENPDFMSKSFSYMWEIDGRKAGHEPFVSCACGSSARVRVTEVATGRRVTKTITLKGCSKGETKTKVAPKASQH